MVHSSLCWRPGLSWAPLLSRLRLPGASVGVVPRLAAVKAGAKGSLSLLSGRSCRTWSLRCWRSWWSTSRRCRQPLALPRLLLLSRRVLLRWPLLVLLWRPVLRLLVLLRLLEARTSVAAGSNGDNLPLLVLHLQVLALSVERAVNQMVEVVEAEVEQRVLEVVLKTLHEVLLLLAVIRNISRGLASKLQETITILR